MAARTVETRGFYCNYAGREALRKTLGERFFESIREQDGCWVWQGVLDSWGYGLFYDAHAGKQVRAHRFSYRLHRGEFDQGLKVLHRCDNPPCVNPADLFLGTIADNVADMMKKGRNGHVRGEKHYASKLTRDQVLEIRSSSLSLRQAAIEYGVSKSLVAGIRSRRKWSHL